MGKLLMVLVTCVFVKALENRHHPEFVRAFEECEWPKIRQAHHEYVTENCNSSLDYERDSLTAQATCGAPKEVYTKLRPSASYVEVNPAAVWIKRCLGLCGAEGMDYKCVPVETIKRQISVKLVNIRTEKESCALYTISEHATCECKLQDGRQGVRSSYVQTRRSPRQPLQEGPEVEQI